MTDTWDVIDRKTLGSDSAFANPESLANLDNIPVPEGRPIALDRKYEKEFRDVLSKSGVFINSVLGKDEAMAEDLVQKMNTLNPQDIANKITRGHKFSREEIAKIVKDLTTYKEAVKEAYDKYKSEDKNIKDHGEILLKDDTDDNEGGAIDDAILAVAKGTFEAANNDQADATNNNNNSSNGATNSGGSSGSGSSGGSNSQNSGGSGDQSPLDKLKELLGGGEQSAEEKAQEEVDDAQDAAEQAQREAEAAREAAEEEAERLREELEEERAQNEEDENTQDDQNDDESTNDQNEDDNDSPIATLNAVTNALIVKFVNYNELNIYNRIGAEVGETAGAEDFNASFVQQLAEQEPAIFEQYKDLSEGLNAVQAINAYVVLSIAISDESFFFSLRDDVLNEIESINFATEFEADLAFDAYFAEALSETDFEIYASLVREITGEAPSELITEDSDASSDDQDDDVVDDTGSGELDLEAFVALLMTEVDLSDSDMAILDTVIEFLNGVEDTSGDPIKETDVAESDPVEPSDNDIVDLSNDIIYEPVPILADDGMIIGWNYPEYNSDGSFAGYGEPVYLNDIPSFDVGNSDEPVSPDIVEPVNPDIDEVPVYDGDNIPVPETETPVQDDGDAYAQFNGYVEAQVKMLLPQLHNKIEMSIEDQFGNLSQNEFNDHFANVTQQHYGHVFEQIQSGYDGVMPGDDMMATMSHDAQDVVDQGGVDSNLDVLLGTTSEAAPVVQEVAQQGVEVTIEMAENIDLETVINHDIM